MNEEKKFKIEKLEKYGKEWNDNNQELKNIYLIGVCSLLCTFLGASGIKEYWTLNINTAPAINTIITSLTTLGSYSSFMSIKYIIQSIGEKTKLEKKIDEINDMLDEMENEEKESVIGGR